MREVTGKAEMSHFGVTGAGTTRLRLWLIRIFLGVVLLSAVAVASGAGFAGLYSTPPATADSGQTTYSAPTERCVLNDKRLVGTTGLTVRGGGVYLSSDRSPDLLRAIDAKCGVAEEIKLSIPTGTGSSANHQDIATASDGSIWLADIGAPRALRRSVMLYRWGGTGTSVQEFELRYPDGAHDAQALLMSLDGNLVVITNDANGHNGVYVAEQPLSASAALTKVMELALPASDGVVTGGAVAPDGTHFVLRTDRAVFEWDAPDIDVIAALRNGKPRTFSAAAGSAIGYSADSTQLLTIGRSVPGELEVRTISRAAPAVSAQTRISAPVAFGAAASIGLLVVIAVVSWRRRRLAGGTTTYQSSN